MTNESVGCVVVCVCVCVRTISWSLKYFMAHSRYKNSNLLNKACTLTYQGLGFRAKLSYFGTSPLANMQMYRVESSSTIANSSFLLYF